jgi:hypothetical protein
MSGTTTTEQQHNAGTTGDNPAEVTQVSSPSAASQEAPKQEVTTGKPAETAKQDSSSEPAWFEGRLQRAERAAVGEFARELGYDSPDALKTALTAVADHKQLSNQASKYKSDYDALATEFKAILQAEIDGVPEEHRERLSEAMQAAGENPIAQMKIIRSLKPLFVSAQTQAQQGKQKASPPRYESGTGSQTGQGTGLTPAEEAVAQRLGVSLEQYKAQKDALKK